MRILIFMLMLSLMPCFGFAQNQIAGKIVDELGFPVYMASVEINGTETIVYTDYEGAFILSSKKDFHWKINIKSKGYKPESFFVLNGGNTGAIVLEYDAEMKELLSGTSGVQH